MAKTTSPSNLDYFRSKLRIDRNNLDECLEQQPSLFQEVGHEHTLAVSRRDAAREEQKGMDARLYIAIRSELEDAGEKVTEAAITSRIEKHAKHQQARVKYKDASLASEQWSNLKESFLQRGFALKDLVQLYIASYYSEASAGESKAVAGDMRAAKAKKKRASLRAR